MDSDKLPCLFLSADDGSEHRRKSFCLPHASALSTSLQLGSKKQTGRPEVKEARVRLLKLTLSVALRMQATLPLVLAGPS